MAVCPRYIIWGRGESLSVMIIIGRSRDALLCHWLASGSYAINPIDFTAQKEPITRLFLRIRRLIPGDGVCLLRNGSLVPDKTFHKKNSEEGRSARWWGPGPGPGGLGGTHPGNQTKRTLRVERPHRETPVERHHAASLSGGDGEAVTCSRSARREQRACVRPGAGPSSRRRRAHVTRRAAQLGGLCHSSPS